jgi:acetoin utilization deacetylase AcuC-like enzyme
VVRCFYHPDYTFPLPEEHPFPMDKFWRAAAMIRGAVPAGLTIESVSPVPLALVERVHRRDYLERVRAGTLDRVAALKLGLPAGEALLTRSRLETAGTLAAVYAALADGLACNLAGGTHHAFPDRGLGYCVLNDVAVAVRDLHDHAPGTRVLVVDTDAHQGNGTHAIFAADPRVFTYSIHVGANYPAEKTPGDRDVPLPRYADGSTWLAALAETLPPVWQEFGPDLVIWIAGADLHEHDRFGQLRLTDADFVARDDFVLNLAKTRGTPLAILYGGGYNRDRVHTARLHAATVLRAAGGLDPIKGLAPPEDHPLDQQQIGHPA